jgi:hypothetical protein
MSSADKSPVGTLGEGIDAPSATVIIATAPQGLGSFFDSTDDSIVVNNVTVSPAPPADSQGSIPINNELQAGTLVLSTNGRLVINLPGQVDAVAGNDHTLDQWIGTVQPLSVSSPPNPAIITEGPYLQDPVTLATNINQLGGGIASAADETGDSQGAGSNQIKNLAYNVVTAGWAPGMTITDTAEDIVAGTTIKSISSDGLTVTLSQNFKTGTTGTTGTIFTVDGRPTLESFLSSMTAPVSLNSPEIIINAAVVDVDGIIQSGESDYNLTLDSTEASEIAALIAGGDTVTTPLPTQPSPLFQVYWQPKGSSGQIVVAPVRVNGGDVEITGDVVNSGAGQINVLGGYGNINITNNTPYAIEVQQLDASKAGIGTLLINDTSALGSVSFFPAQTSPPVVDFNNSTIMIGGNSSGLQTGQQVTYNAEKHTPIGGLTDGHTYFANVNEVVNDTNNTIFFGLNTGLSTGDIVTYNAEGHSEIAGLTAANNSGSVTPGQFFVRVNGDGTVSLYDTQAHATDTAHTTGLRILGNSGGGSEQEFTFSGGPGFVKFNPTGTVLRLYDNQVDANAGGSAGLVGLTGSVTNGMGPVQEFTFTPANVGAGFTANQVKSTLYQETNGDLTITTASGVLDQQSATEQYDPMSTWRYGWTVGLDVVDKLFSIETSSSWLGIISTGSGYTGPFASSTPLGPPSLQGAGAYYYTDSSALGPYTFDSTKQVLSDSYSSKGLHTSTTWYGTTTITVEHDDVQGQFILDNTTISAHNPINIQFIGYAQGTVTVNSTGNVIVDGPILNPTGTTTITSQGSIETAGNVGVVGGNQVVLQAQTGIGDSGGPLQVEVGPTSVQFDPNGTTPAPANGPIVDTTNNTIFVGQTNVIKQGQELTYNAEGNNVIGGLTNGNSYLVFYNAQNGTIQLFDTQAHAMAAFLNNGTAGLVDLTSNIGTGTVQEFTITTPNHASLNATTATGDINLLQVTSAGDLPVDTVMSDSLGTVTLSAPGGSILVAQGGQGLVSGGAINLIAENNVGNSTGTPLTVDTPSGTDILGDRLTITGVTPLGASTSNPLTGSVFIEEKSGDLQVNSIDAIGDVWVDVPNGNLVNANTNQTVDQRTEAQLLAGVWSDLQLTDATGFKEQVQAVVSTYTAAQEESYQAYWQFRNEQPDPSVFDPKFTVTLTDAQVAYYTSIGVDIQTLENRDTAEYHVLNAEFSGFDDFIVNPTNSTIFLPNLNGLQTGDKVTYSATSGTAIDFSQSGPYYARLLGNGLIQLYDNEADALTGNSGLITFTYAPAGTQVAGVTQEFTFSPSVLFNPSTQGVVDTTTNTIYLGANSGLVTGDQVTYDAEGNPVIGGLTDGSTYFVNVQSGGNVQLFTSQANAEGGLNATFDAASAVNTVNNTIAVGANSGIQTGEQVTYNVGSLSFNATAVNTLTSTIAVAASSGFVTGEQVIYTVGTGNTGVGGLTSGGVYFVNLQNGNLSLYNTAANALSGGATGQVTLTSTGTGMQSFTGIAVGGLANAVNFDAATAVSTVNSTIAVGASSGLVNGEQVIYSAGGTSAVGGLTDGGVYYANVHSGNLKLYNTAANALSGGATGLVQLTSASTGTQSFTGVALGGLGNGGVYYANVQNGNLSLYNTAANALAGGTTGQVRLTSAGTGTQSFTGGAIGLTSTGGGSEQRFITSTTSNAAFNPTGTTIHRDAIVNTSTGRVGLTNSIFVGLATGLQTGDAVVYSAGTGNAIGGLTSGNTYFVNVQSNGTIQLYDNETDAIAGGSGLGSGLETLSSTGSGTAQTFTYNPSIHFNPAAPGVINTSTNATDPNTIFLPAGNGLSTGDAVQYDIENSTLSFGLTNGHTYFVNVHSDGLVSFYDNATDAKNGTNVGLVTLSATTGSGSDQKFIVTLTNSPPIHFNPTAPSVINTSTNATDPNTIFLPAGNGLSTGDTVQYDNEAIR